VTGLGTMLVLSYKPPIPTSRIVQSTCHLAHESLFVQCSRWLTFMDKKACMATSVR